VMQGAENLHKVNEFSYRRLTCLPEKEKVGTSTDDTKEIYEIFIEPHDGQANAIKLYEHGLQMFSEGRYEIAVSDFKKVNQLLEKDAPSQIFIKRCQELMQREERSKKEG